MTSRFVILHHRLSNGEHWDLMLEHGDFLATWQLMKPPAGPSSFPIAARRIGDHRKAYLDYEGPLSRGRGEVRRIDRGLAAIRKFTGEECAFAVQGDLLRGAFLLLRTHGEDWVLECDLTGGPQPAAIQ